MRDRIHFDVGPGLTRTIRVGLSPWARLWAAAYRRGILGEPEVGTSPHLDPDALRRWREILRNTQVYVEYGSGGSTVEAVQQASWTISVENDQRFLQAVETVVASLRLARKPNFVPLYVDTGLTEKWGRPVMPWPSPARLSRWRGYPVAPWGALEERDLVPDFVFIDGRFRAASVLASILRLPRDADCIFMLDDFTRRRRHYRIVLPFISNTELVGRALVFRRSSNFDAIACAASLRRAQADPE